jgi:hypothetical protein
MTGDHASALISSHLAMKGVGIHELFETLRRAGVWCVLDIRYNPAAL